jgi:hypothetical protein
MIRDLDHLVGTIMAQASPRLGVLRLIATALVIHRTISHFGRKLPHLLTSVRRLTDPDLHRASALIHRKAMVTGNITVQATSRARRVVATAVVEVREWLQIESFLGETALLHLN